MLWITLLGCVIRYGDPVETAVTEPLPQPVSYADVEQRIESLLSRAENVDQIDRLEAAQQLARHMKTQDPRAQRVVLDYLLVVIDVEAREDPAGVSAILAEELPEPGIAVIAEEILEEDLSVEPGEPSDDAPPSTDAIGAADRSSRISPLDADQMRADAQALIEAGDLLAAMEALAPCEEGGCWDAVSDMWTRTRDLHVYQQREAAAALYLEAREAKTAAEQRRLLSDAEELLAGLLEDYPETPYTAAINRSVDLVQEALAELESE